MVPEGPRRSNRSFGAGEHHHVHVGATMYGEWELLSLLTLGTPTETTPEATRVSPTYRSPLGAKYVVLPIAVEPAGTLGNVVT